MLPRIAVHPPAAWSVHGALLQAVGAAEDVEFRPGSRDLRDADGALLLAGSRFSTGEVTAAGIPSLIMTDRQVETDRVDRPVEVLVAGGDAVERPLRGASIHESRVGRAIALDRRDAVAVATAAGFPVWLAKGGSPAEPVRVDSVGVPPPALGPGERLVDALQPGRWLGLAALVTLARTVLGEQRLRPPVDRASFLIDDPNLHWISYGFLHFPRLVEEAERVGFHLALGLVPLDCWWADPRASRLLRDHPAALSLAMHGNDHVKAELAREQPSTATRAAVAQAQRRVSTFERRHRLKVDRVMVSPHGVCDPRTAEQLLLTGYDAICYSGAPPGDDGPTAGWGVAGLTPAGLPVIPRVPIGAPRALLALRAFVGHPLVLYGHHDDLADGFRNLSDAARAVSEIADVRWTSLGEIARTRFSSRVTGEDMELRLLSRRAAVDVPEGVRQLIVHTPAARERSDVLVVGGHHIPDGGTERPVEIALDGRAQVVPVALTARQAVDPSLIARPAWRPWPLLRRILSESRDRVAPLRPR